MLVGQLVKKGFSKFGRKVVELEEEQERKPPGDNPRE